MAKKLSEQEKQERLLLFEKMEKEYILDEEITVVDLCKKHNASYPVFYKYLKEKNAVVQKPRKPRYSSDFIDTVKKDYVENNLTLTAISEKYNVAAPTAARWLNRDNIETKNKRYQVPSEKKIFAKTFYEEGLNSITAAKKAGIGKNTFRRFLKENNLLRKTFTVVKNPDLKSSFFEKIDTEEKAYWFGFIYADGCVRETHNSLVIEISKNDKHHLEKFRETINANTPIKERTRILKSGNSSTVVSLCIYSEKLINDLTTKGCIQKKTYNGYLYDNVFSEKKLKMAFLRGYIDGDGYISKEKTAYSASIVVHNYKIMNYLLNIIIKEIGIIPHIRYEQDELGGAYRMRIMNKADFFAFFDAIYEDQTICLQRKYDNYLKHSRPASTTTEDAEIINGELSGEA